MYSEDKVPFKKASIPLALIYYFVSQKRYVEMASDHAMWINLQASDLNAAYERGEFPKEGWRNESFSSENSLLRKSRWKLLQSLFYTMILASIVIVVGFVFGIIDFSASIDISKATTYIGVSIVCWANLYQIIGVPLRTYAGNTLNELIHKYIFLVLMILGVLTALIGLVV